MFRKKIDIDHGHDWAFVSYKGGGPGADAMIEVVISGRGCADITITISPKDAKFLGYALLEAVSCAPGGLSEVS